MWPYYHKSIQATIYNYCFKRDSTGLIWLQNYSSTMYILFSALHLKKEMIFPWRVKLTFHCKMIHLLTQNFTKLSYQFLLINQVCIAMLAIEMPIATFQMPIATLYLARRLTESNSWAKHCTLYKFHAVVFLSYTTKFWLYKFYTAVLPFIWMEVIWLTCLEAVNPFCDCTVTETLAILKVNTFAQIKRHMASFGDIH